jgi:hypothetical protein
MDWAPILAFVTGMFSGALSCTHDSWRCDSHAEIVDGLALVGFAIAATRPLRSCIRFHGDR